VGTAHSRLCPPYACWSDLNGERFPNARTIDKLRMDPEFKDKVADAIIAAVPFDRNADAAA
jgi:hypothetical protein